jgi:hypothetical protein
MALTIALGSCDCDMVSQRPASSPSSAVSSIATTAAPMDQESIASLGAYVRANASDPIDRVKALHDWVALHIAYDVALSITLKLPRERAASRAASASA